MINKDHGTLQKFYMGEEGNQKHLEELHYCCWLLQANASGELGVGGGGLEELRMPAPQLQIRHEHRDLAKVNQLAHNSTPPRPGVVITIYNQSAVGRVRQQDQKTGGQERRVQGHISRPCINKLRARAER